LFQFVIKKQTNVGLTSIIFSLVFDLNHKKKHSK